MPDNGEPRNERLDLLLVQRGLAPSRAKAQALILAGRVHAEPERSFGIVIFRADDEAAAQAMMQADPAVNEGLMTAELYEFPLAFAGEFTAES